jgi:hypothetical protein
MAFDPNIRLIHPICIMGHVEPRSTALLRLQRIALHPAKHGGVVDHRAAFAREGFHITLPQGIPQMPPRHVEEEIGFNMAPVDQGSIEHGRPPRN